METLLLIILFPTFFGWVAGHIFIIAKYIKLVDLENPFFNFSAKILFVIFSIIVLNLPGLIASFTRPPHDLWGNREYTAFDHVIGIVGIIWYLVISFIGIYIILRDWYLKFRTIKDKKLEKYNKSLESDA